MYDPHALTISERCNEKPEYFFATVKFVFHTIQRQFWLVNPENKLMTVQKTGINFVRNNLEELYDSVFSSKSLECKLDDLMKTPGLNLVKSAFVLQLTGHEIGCIDVHNAKLLGVSSDSLIMNKSRTKDRKKVWQYIGMCQSKEMGGSEGMWNSWCENIATLYPNYFKDSCSVSHFHLTSTNSFYEKVVKDNATCS
jgi:hypothetical protein